MEGLNLLKIRENCAQQRIMLCFNGPTSRSLIEEIGHALRSYMQDEKALPSASMDVFAVYIEMTQNIRHYASRRGYVEQDATATVTVARDEHGRYVISAGNVVEYEDGRHVVQTVEALATLDKAQLKAAYKEQLRRPRDPDASSGAGLGLLDIARKSTEPMQAFLTEHPNGRAFISLRAVI